MSVVNASYSALGAGGAASKGPMIERRSRAHRSRCGGSVGVFKWTPGSGVPGWYRHWECRLRNLGFGGDLHPLRELSAPLEA